MKTIAIYGGSFNPPTLMHRQIGLDVLDQLPVDEVWYLVSPQNPYKSTIGMADFQDRITMVRINLDNHPRLIVTDIEAAYVKEMGTPTILTGDTLRLLTRDFPDCRFMWVMGADNLQHFHTWEGGDYIEANFPMIIVPRQDYTEAALQSVTAQKLPRLTRDKNSKEPAGVGLYILDTEENDIAASKCKVELAAGTLPQAMRPAVASYALSNRLYTCEKT